MALDEWIYRWEVSLLSLMIFFIIGKHIKNNISWKIEEKPSFYSLNVIICVRAKYTIVFFENNCFFFWKIKNLLLFYWKIKKNA
jgi:hypothetical protein